MVAAITNFGKEVIKKQPNSVWISKISIGHIFLPTLNYDTLLMYLPSVCIVMQTRFSQIQEHPKNFNSVCKKTLLRLIFNKKFQLLEWWRPLEALG